MTLTPMLKRPTAVAPLVMSAAALGLVTTAMVTGYRSDTGDEGILARIWQLLIAGQLPFMLAFAARGLVEAPARALAILGLQGAAATAAVAQVVILGL